MSSLYLKNNQKKEQDLNSKKSPPTEMHKVNSLLNLQDETKIQVTKPKIPITKLIEDDYFFPSSLPSNNPLDKKIEEETFISPRSISANKKEEFQPEKRNPKSFDIKREPKNKENNEKLALKDSPEKYKRGCPSPLPSNETLKKLDNTPKETVVIEAPRDEKSCKEKCQLCNLLCAVTTFPHKTHLCASYHRCSHECDSKNQGYCNIQNTMDLGKSKQVGKREKW